MGTIYNMQGGYPQAIEYYKKANEIREQMGNEQGLAVGYGNLGNSYLQQGDLEWAIQAYKKSLEYSIRLGMDQASAQVYNNLGIVHQEQGQYDLAIKMYQKSLEIELRIGDKWALPAPTATSALSMADSEAMNKLSRCSKKRWKLMSGLAMNPAQPRTMAI
jgi:tetratricopeptide (TPR) repeat protein